MRRWLLPLALGFAACKGDEDPGTATDPGAVDADVYQFPSRFDGEDSVAYDGQVMRQVLIEQIKIEVGELTAAIDSGYTPAAGDVTAELDRYFSFDSVADGQVPFGYTTDPAPLQAVWDDLSTDKDLVSKLAGNDPAGQHRDWNAVGIDGWTGSPTPEALVRTWFADIDAVSVARANGATETGPDGVVLPVHVGLDGVDRRELLDKFLRVAVAFSQGADDYLDDADADKGILADHSAADGDANYTPLEHQWDEGFGYFGASRTYGAWDDATIAVGWADEDGDGAIDVLTEVAFGHAVNAAKRDADSVSPTDFTHEAWAGFHAGRALIAANDGPLDDAALDELRGHRDRAVGNWERAIAASAVHYINDVLDDMSTFGTADYVFLDHAKHWSELKGFALGLQFNPDSPLSDAEFARLHTLLRDAPVLPGDPGEGSYADDLLEARDLLGAAYGFDAADVLAW